MPNQMPRRWTKLCCYRGWTISLVEVVVGWRRMIRQVKGTFVKLSVGRSVVLLLVVAAIIRGGALWIAFDQLRDDPDAYDQIAQTLATTGTFGVLPDGPDTLPTAYRPPLYPAILASIHRSMIATGGELQDPLDGGNAQVSRLAIAIFHWAVSLATVLATYFVALRMIGLLSDGLPSWRHATSNRVNFAAIFAAFLVIIDPILLQSSVRVMTETLAALLAILALYCWCRLVHRLSKPKSGENFSAIGSNGELPASIHADSEQQPDAQSAPAWRSVAFLSVQLGVILGLAYLCRPTFVVWTALLIGYLYLWAVVGVWTHRQRIAGQANQEILGGTCRQICGPSIPSMFAASMLVALSFLFVGAWTLRNQMHFGKPIWATTHGGYTLLLGNNPSFYRYMRTGGIGNAWEPDAFFQRWEMRYQADPRRIEFWDTQRPPAVDPDWQSSFLAAGTENELREDRLAYETARVVIADDKPGFALATLWRIGRLLSPMPQVFPKAGLGQRIGAVLVTLFYCAWIVLIIGAMVRLSRKLLQPEWIATFALVLSLVAVHSIYWSNMRMRAPAVPSLAILAAVAVSGRIRS
jgi:hypothetical protein